VKNILITGTGGRSFGAGIIHALLRSDAEVTSRWNVIAADASSFAWGLYKTNSSELLPLAYDENYISKLNEAIDKHKIDAIIPGTQQETEVILNNINKLKNVIVIGNRKNLIPLMMDKFKLQDSLRSLGMSIIETRPLLDWKAVAQEYGFPLIIKPASGSGGSKGLHLVEDEDGIKPLLERAYLESALCVQPYIGTPEEEYTIGVVTDREGTLIDSIAMKRKLVGLSLLYSKKIKGCRYEISTGYSQGYIIKHPKIQALCEDLALRLDSRGPLNIQLRIHNENIYIFDLHPRFSGSTPIRADVGFNEVDILLRNFIYWEKFSRLNYRYDVAAIRAFEHVIVPIQELK